LARFSVSHLSVFNTGGAVIPTIINLENDVLCVKLCFYSHAEILYLFIYSFTFVGRVGVN
jgi:hypothetical protein